MSEMPKWPTEPPRNTQCAKLDLMGALSMCNDIVHYERARAEAAMERLKVAVEALQSRSHHLDCPDPHYSCAQLGFNANGDEPCNCGAQSAIDALALIDMPEGE
jgi:hypothetical protein